MSDNRGCIGRILDLFFGRADDNSAALPPPGVMVSNRFISNAERSFMPHLDR